MINPSDKHCDLAKHKEKLAAADKAAAEKQVPKKAEASSAELRAEKGEGGFKNSVKSENGVPKRFAAKPFDEEAAKKKRTKKKDKE